MKLDVMMGSHHASSVFPCDAGLLSDLSISVLLLLHHHHLYPATPCPLLVLLKQKRANWQNMLNVKLWTISASPGSIQWRDNTITYIEKTFQMKGFLFDHYVQRRNVLNSHTKEISLFFINCCFTPQVSFNPILLIYQQFTGVAMLTKEKHSSSWDKNCSIV